MKTYITSFVAMAGLVSAGNAVVKNSCSSNIYVQSFPYSGSQAGPLTTLKPGATFSEKFVSSGSVCFKFYLVVLYKFRSRMYC